MVSIIKLQETTKKHLFSVEAGMDMNMHGPEFYDFVVDLVNEKKLSIDRVNEACSKILYAKFQLGLFENRLVDKSKIDKMFS